MSRWHSPIDQPLPKGVQLVVRRKQRPAGCQITTKTNLFRTAGACPFAARYVVDGKRMCGQHYRCLMMERERAKRPRCPHCGSVLAQSVDR